MGIKLFILVRRLLEGLIDELSNDRVKTRWNTPLMVQDALKILVNKVIQENK